MYIYSVIGNASETWRQKVEDIVEIIENTDGHVDGCIEYIMVIAEHKLAEHYKYSFAFVCFLPNIGKLKHNPYTSCELVYYYKV